MKLLCIAETRLNWQQIIEWLDDMGALPWALKFANTNPRDADGLTELAGRRCYLSFGTAADGLNPNVVKIREDQAAYIANILTSKHGSVVEHAQYTFALEGVSRVLTHELVRHRPGTAVSQESGRYVRLSGGIDFEHPDIFDGHDNLKVHAQYLLGQLAGFQDMIAHAYDLDNPKVPFHLKKEITSAMRRYSPEGRSTGLVWSANVRALRHIIETRSATGAEAEIREFANKLAEIMIDKAPLLFADFEMDEEGQWVPQTSKV